MNKKLKEQLIDLAPYAVAGIVIGIVLSTRKAAKPKGTIMLELSMEMVEKLKPGLRVEFPQVCEYPVMLTILNAPIPTP